MPAKKKLIVHSVRGAELTCGYRPPDLVIVYTSPLAADVTCKGCLAAARDVATQQVAS